MTSARKFIACTVVFTIAGVHACCFIARKELWPFSHYQMYAGIRASTWTTIEIAGVAADENSSDVKLPTEGVNPPRNIRVSHGINRLVLASEADAAATPRLNNALRSVAELYNRELPSIEKDFTPLRGIRLYRQEWTRDTDPNGRHSWRMLQREKIAEALLEV
jgi:hypothetical protein